MPSRTLSASDRRPLPRWLTVLLVIGGLALLVARRHQEALTGWLWAEDGAEFLRDALLPGADILTPYNGQLWVVQRLAFALIDAAPLAWAPLLILVISLVLITGSVAVVLQSRLTELFRGRGLQALAFVLLLATPGAWESTGLLLTVHWWFPVGASLLLMAPAPRSRAWLVVELAWLVVIGLTGLTSWIVLPVAIAAVIVRQEGITIVRLVVILATAVVQGITLVNSPRALAEVAAPLDFARIALQRVGSVAIAGERGLADVTTRPVLIAVLAAGAAFLLAVLLVALMGRRWPGIALVTSAVIATVLGILGADEPSALLQAPYGGRYFLPALTFAILILVLGIRGRPRWTRIVAVVALVGMSFAFVVDFLLPPVTPLLDAQEWQTFTACVESGESGCSIDIAPAGWKVTLP